MYIVSGIFGTNDTGIHFALTKSVDIVTWKMTHLTLNVFQSVLFMMHEAYL